MKPFIPWVGGKTALRPVLYRLFPHRFHRYVEVFGGSAALLFGRSPQRGQMEIYNDLDRDLVNLFLCVKYRTLAFCKEMKWLPLNSRKGFEVLKNFLQKEEPEDRFLQEELDICAEFFTPKEAKALQEILRGQAALWDVQRAAAYYKVIRYSYGAGGNSYGAKPLDICRGLAHIWACSRRLKDVVVENLSYEAAIPRYDEPGTLLYLDPPYYEAECYDVPFNFEDHLRLQRLVCECEGAFVALSYNDHPFIRELYQGFWQFTATRPNPLRNRSGGGEYEELIILNYDPEKYAKPQQMTLFQVPEREPGEKKYTQIAEGEEDAEKRKEIGKQNRERLERQHGRKRPHVGTVAETGGGDGKDRLSPADGFGGAGSPEQGPVSPGGIAGGCGPFPCHRAG